MRYKRRAAKQYARKKTVRKAAKTARKTSKKTTKKKAKSSARIKKILIYNPTYGSLQPKRLDKTLPEESWWEQSYVSPGRYLKKSEIKELLKKGKMGTYPDEFFLVKKRGRWTEKRVKKHLKQIEAFRETNENGEPFRWRDRYGNEEEKIYLNFVPGPIVDFINSTSKKRAVEGLTRFMLNQAASSSRRKESFQMAVRRHAEKLVEAVRKGRVVKSTKVKEPIVPNLW